MQKRVQQASFTSVRLHIQYITLHRSLLLLPLRTASIAVTYITERTSCVGRASPVLVSFRMIEEVTSVENESACACLCVLISSEHLTCLATRLSSLPLLFRPCLNPTLSASLSVTDTHAHTHTHLTIFPGCHTLSLRQILCESVPRIHPHHPTDRPTDRLSEPVSLSLPLSLSLCPKSNRNTTLTLSLTQTLRPTAAASAAESLPRFPFLSHSLSLSRFILVAKGVFILTTIYTTSTSSLTRIGPFPPLIALLSSGAAPFHGPFLVSPPPSP